MFLVNLAGGWEGGAMFSGRTYFLSALYHLRGGFSHLPSFLRYARPLSSLPFERLAVLQNVERLREEYSTMSGPIDQQAALRLLVAEEFERVMTVLKDSAITEQIDARDEEGMRRHLEQCCDKAIDFLQTMGVDVDCPRLFVVDQLPYPYTNGKYAALMADEGDRTLYGIQPGIYFLSKSLVPFYSEFLLCHELIHVVLGKRSPDQLACGLEEGLAELIGAMYLSSKILGPELTANLFIYNRLSDEYTRFWEFYVDGTHLAALLYHRLGLSGVFELLKQKRETVKALEDQCFHMNFSFSDSLRPTIYRADPDPAFSDLVDFLALAFSRSLVVSPLAKYLMRHISVGRSVAEILDSAHVERTPGEKALRELEQNYYLLAFSGGESHFERAIVSLSECHRFSKDSVMRYEIPNFTGT